MGTRHKATWANLLQGYRRSAGLSQTGLAELLNVSRDEVNLWERADTDEPPAWVLLTVYGLRRLEQDKMVNPPGLEPDLQDIRDKIRLHTLLK